MSVTIFISIVSLWISLSILMISLLSALYYTNNILEIKESTASATIYTQHHRGQLAFAPV